MSEHADRATHRLKLGKALCALFLAAGVGACDKCGDWLRLQSDRQLEVCREQAPRPQ